MHLMKGFWSLFKNVTVTTNSGSGANAIGEHPMDSEVIKKLRALVDILVEQFTIDSQNKIAIQLSVPVLNHIEEDAERCRQLINSPSPQGEGKVILEEGLSPAREPVRRAGRPS